MNGSPDQSVKLAEVIARNGDACLHRIVLISFSTSQYHVNEISTVLFLSLTNHKKRGIMWSVVVTKSFGFGTLILDHDQKLYICI
jgi:hypothetical protein